MTTIPASAIVNVTPNVLAASGAALDLNGLGLSTSTRVPIGTVQSFPSAASVSEFFGATALETTLAAIYFAGFDNSNAKPGAMLWAQYNEDDVWAYLRGGDVSGFTVAQLQALNGLLAVAIDGVVQSATINLAAATSFSSAAQIIQTDLGIEGVAAAAVTGSISGTTLTVTAVASGSLAVGQYVTGTGVAADTIITALVTGTGGVGTYTVSTSQTALSQSMDANEPGVYYDSVSGAFVIQSGTAGDDSTMAFGSGALATSLLLTQALGAVLSQGADAVATPAAFMDALILITQNWATFFTAFDPDAADENTVKLAFANWTSLQNNRYAYVCWDEDLSPSAAAPAAASLGALIAAAEDSGTILIGRDSADYADLVDVAAFVSGAIASIDFDQAGGRATLAFRQQSGLTASVTDQAKAENLIANGYNFYGAYATANDEFVFFYPGSISGDFLWVDSFVNQIWLNNAFQLALMTLLTQALSIPYNAAGRAQIEASLSDPIDAALNFGAIQTGVALSASQAAAVNAEAATRISDTLEQRGWYLQVLDASAAVRQARGSPPCKFWYMDGQSVQQIDLSSVAVL